MADPADHASVPNTIPDKPDIDFSATERRERIGSGGTADVYKVVDRGSGQTVAVKEPHFEGTLSEDIFERFVSEARTWERLDDHGGIVGVVDWEDEPVPRIALEYMDGGPLTDRIGDLELEEALWTGLRVADAVWWAHSRGVAHLDLKPDNILFRTTGPDTWDVPKVSDWGLARLLLYHSQSVEGLSPTYSAPEQFDPDTYGSPDQITDVYQLGTIVYEVLTGEPPFSGSARAVMNRHLTEWPARATTVNAMLPAEVDDALMAALAKRKEDRYESMLDFRRDLSALFRRVAFDADVTFVCEGRSGAGYGNERSPPKPEPGGPAEPDATGHEPTDFSSGSTLRRGEDEPGVLDNIREQQEAREERRFPWQRRENAPGLDREAAGNLHREYRDDFGLSKPRGQEPVEEDPAPQKPKRERSGGLVSKIKGVVSRLFGD